jgi:hypothetical protein
MKRPYEVGWFFDPMFADGVVKVTRVFDGAWFITPYAHHGDKNPNGAGQVLTMKRWNRLEPIR